MAAKELLESIKEDTDHIKKILEKVHGEKQAGKKGDRDIDKYQRAPAKYSKTKECEAWYGHFDPMHQVKKSGKAQYPTKINHEELEVVHVTDLEPVLNIIDEGFLGGAYEMTDKFDEKQQLYEMNFSWWSLALPKDRLEILEKTLSFNNPSPVVSKNVSRYGNFRFTWKLNKLIDAYKNSLGCTNVTFRIFGTLKYRCEVMYTVVVCGSHPRDLNMKKLHTLPLIPEASEEIQVLYNGFEDGKKLWYMNMDAITSNLWDHISFAFYLPSDKKITVKPEDILEHLDIVQPDSLFFKQRRSGSELLRTANKYREDKAREAVEWRENMEKWYTQLEEKISSSMD